MKMFNYHLNSIRSITKHVRQINSCLKHGAKRLKSSKRSASIATQSDRMEKPNMKEMKTLDHLVDRSYFGQYNSFPEMVQFEKYDAKSYIMLEDETGHFDLLDIQTATSIVGSEVSKIYKFKCQNKRLALVRLRNYQQFRKDQSPTFRDNSFPVSSRMFKLKTFPRQLKGIPQRNARYNEILDLNETFNAINFMKKQVNINSAIDGLLKSQLMNEFNVKLRFFIINQLEEFVCKGIFNEFHILPFGSSVNGFGTNSSDIDLVVCPKVDMNSNNNSNSHLKYLARQTDQNYRCLSQDCVRVVGDMIRFLGFGFEDVSKIVKARIPIIKFRSVLTGHDCDMSFANFANPHSVVMADMLYSFSLDLRVKKLIIFLKQWAKCQKLTRDTPGYWMTNFTLLMLVVGFFQRHELQLLPPMKQNIVYQHFRHRNAVKYVKDIDLEFESLLRNFFHYVSVFDFQEYGLSLYSGTVVTKPTHSALYIENPLERDLNIALNLSHDELERFIKSARESYIKLDNNSSFHDILDPVLNDDQDQNNPVNLKSLDVTSYYEDEENGL